jgi:hypothetical protein
MGQFCGGFLSNVGMVTWSAPFLKWARNKTVYEVQKRIMARGGTCEELSKSVHIGEHDGKEGEGDNAE